MDLMKRGKKMKTNKIICNGEEFLTLEEMESQSEAYINELILQDRMKDDDQANWLKEQELEKLIRSLRD